MKSHHSRCSGIRVRIASACVFMWAAGSGTVHADMTPVTGVHVQVLGGATGGNFQDQQNPTNADAPSSASVSKAVAGSDGSTAGASAAAFADFGTLGVAGTAGGVVPPATPAGVASGAALASASWDDFLTAFPNPGSLLVPGTSVTANLVLGLDFQNSTLAINNASSIFAYELFAGIVITDPATGVQSSSTVLDDCFVFNDPDFNLCGRGSNRIDIPGNTNGQPLSIQFAPIALSLAILQPFELGVGLTFDGQCNTGPNDTATSSCSLDADALHTSITTLQPLGDFTLVAASGHDYSPRITAPPGSVPEPGTLALIASGLVPAALSLRGRRKRER